MDFYIVHICCTNVADEAIIVRNLTKEQAIYLAEHLPNVAVGYADSTGYAFLADYLDGECVAGQIV
jgi:hypothetical protein